MTTPAKGKQKHLAICPVCGGYMREAARLGAATGKKHYADHRLRRSFGGQELKEFVCEKCQHTETLQIDDLTHIGEDS